MNNGKSNLAVFFVFFFPLWRFTYGYLQRLGQFSRVSAVSDPATMAFLDRCLWLACGCLRRANLASRVSAVLQKRRRRRTLVLHCSLRCAAATQSPPLPLPRHVIGSMQEDALFYVRGKVDVAGKRPKRKSLAGTVPRPPGTSRVQLSPHHNRPNLKTAACTRAIYANTGLRLWGCFAANYVEVQ